MLWLRGWYNCCNITNPAIVGDSADPIYVDQNPFGYCGEYLDKETQEIYLRARYYDTATGRFTAEDPLRDGTNWYGYCDNDPVNKFDPTGCATAPAGSLPKKKSQLLAEQSAYRQTDAPSSSLPYYFPTATTSSTSTTTSTTAAVTAPSPIVTKGLKKKTEQAFFIAQHIDQNYW